METPNNAIQGNMAAMPGQQMPSQPGNPVKHDQDFKWEIKVWDQIRGKWRMVRWIPYDSNIPPETLISDDDNLAPGKYRATIYTQDEQKVSNAEQRVFVKELPEEPIHLEREHRPDYRPRPSRDDFDPEPEIEYETEEKKDPIEDINQSIRDAQVERMKAKTNVIKAKAAMKTLKMLEEDEDEAKDKEKDKPVPATGDNIQVQMMQMQMKQMEMQHQQQQRQMEMQQQQQLKQMELQQQQQQQFMERIVTAINSNKKDDGAVVALIQSQNAQTQRFLEIATQTKESPLEKTLANFLASPLASSLLDFIKPKENPIEKLMPTVFEQTMSTMSNYSNQMMEAFIKMQSEPPPISSSDAVSQKLLYWRGLRDIIGPTAKELISTIITATTAFRTNQAAPVASIVSNMQRPDINPQPRSPIVQQPAPQPVPAPPVPNPPLSPEQEQQNAIHQMVNMLQIILKNSPTPEIAANSIKQNLPQIFIDYIVQQDQEIQQFSEATGIDIQKIRATFEYLKSAPAVSPTIPEKPPILTPGTNNVPTPEKENDPASSVSSQPVSNPSGNSAKVS